MGLKSVIAVAPGFFGINAKMVAFVAKGRKPVWKNFMMALVSSKPTIGHAVLKKLEVRPSGPGALFGFIFIITVWISSGVRRVAMLCCKAELQQKEDRP